ncbi:MAG: hypothetical protein SOY76_07905 [Veillonella caviae]|nr:hypothetical protein [Veillonella caviae]
MIKLKQIWLTKKVVVYKYLPWGKEDYGIISYDLETEQPTLIKDDNQNNSEYKGKALSKIKKYHKQDNFPEEGISIWK